MEGSFRVGDCVVRPDLGTVTNHEEETHVEPRAMQVLVYLAEHAGAVVSKDEIFQEVWEGAFVTDVAFSNCISNLRKALHDNAKDPRFIQTIPKKGYRLIAPVAAEAVASSAVESEKSPYPGLAPFAEEDTSFFFGREKEVDVLKERTSGLSLHALVGPSGVGKSSFLQARWSFGIPLALALAATIGFLVTRLVMTIDPTAVVVPRVENPLQVTSAAGVENYPTWSPDGGRVAYQSDQSGNLDIWVTQPTGGRAANRTANHEGGDRHPAWSPDGNQIAFVSGRDGRGIYLMPAIGGLSHRVSPRASYGCPIQQSAVVVGWGDARLHSTRRPGDVHRSRFAIHPGVESHSNSGRTGRSLGSELV